MYSLPKKLVYVYVAVAILLCLGLGWENAYAQSSRGYSTYIVMGEEEDLFDTFLETNRNNNTTRPCHTWINIVSSSDNVQVFLDEHENGYAADPILNPDAKWVIGGTPNELDRGEVLTLQETNTYCPGSTGVDGGDKIIITGSPVTVNRVVFFDVPGAVHAASFELYPTSEWQTTYRVPVGEDLLGASYSPIVRSHDGNNTPGAWAANDPFRYTYLYISGMTSGTTYSVTRPGNTTVNGTLSDVAGVGLNAVVVDITSGSQLTASAPVQAGIFTSHKWGQWDQRFYTLTPEDLLGQEYHIPLPSMQFPGGGTDKEQNTHADEPIDTGAYVYAFENSTLVTIDTAGVQTVASMNAGQVIRVRMPRNTATNTYHFIDGPYPPPTNVIKFSNNGVIKADKKIWVVVAGDDGDNGVDWGFQVINNELLGTEIYVPWGRGNPVHVTPLFDNTTFFVDWYPQDGVVDLTFSLNDKQTYMIYPNVYQTTPHPITGANYDATGARIWATNKFVAVYGQDFSERTKGEKFAGSSGIDSDFGHAIPPMKFTDARLSIQKSLNDGFHPTNPGGTPATEIFTIVLSAHAFDMYNAAITDHLPTGWEFDASFNVSIDLSWDAQPAYSHATGLDPVQTVNTSILTAGNVCTWDISTFMPAILPAGSDHLPPNGSITLVYQAKTKSGATFSTPQNTPAVGFGTTNYAPGDNRYHEFYPTDDVWLYYGNDEPDQLDFGDAPASYSTALAANGARHGIKSSFQLGQYLDPDADGVPSVGALSDDNNQTSSDEDGVTLTSYPLSGQGSQQTVNLTVNAQVTGVAKLHGWYDFNGDGDFDDTVSGVSEKIFANQSLTSGNNSLSFTAPANLTQINTYARFRLSSGTFLNPNGIAVDGEVEDYFLPIGFDWGDAPDATDGTGVGNYKTRSSDSGPRHRVSTLLTMGRLVDVEADGQQNANATGDDVALLDDDDGVTLAGTIFVGSTPTATVNVRNRTASTAYVFGWIDYNSNGLFDNSTERATTTVPANTTANVTLTFPVVPVGSNGSSFARFRVGTTQAQVQNSTGAADNGEVEDYPVTITASSNYDFGDLPDSGPGTGAGNYETTNASSGPKHLIEVNLRIGDALDFEADGQQSATANGDDILGTPDDEDGITLPKIGIGATPIVSVKVYNQTAAPAVLTGWLDYNNNGAFVVGERASVSVPVGTNGYVTLTFPTVPSMTVPVTVGARFRLSTQDDDSDGHLPSTGTLSNGEVEDHQATFVSATFYDFGDAPVSYGDAWARVVGTPNADSQSLLGVNCDGDPLSIYSTNADGDDNNNTDDEDGVVFKGGQVFERGQTIEITATTRKINLGSIMLYSWFDFDGSGSFNNTTIALGGDQIYRGTHTSALTPPSNLDHPITVNMPADPKPGDANPYVSYMRFRSADDEYLGAGIWVNPVGADPANDRTGDIEDYKIIVDANSAVDYGDAPGYTAATHTIHNNGTNYHKELRLGPTVDGDLNGTWSTGGALGDDTDDLFDDEDGVNMPTSINGGAAPAITVNVENDLGGTSYVAGWIDYNNNGSFDNATERAIGSRTGSGTVILTFPTAPTGVSGTRYARFRISTNQSQAQAPSGAADDGEVEDYPVQLAESSGLDYGDLPDSGAGTGVGNYETLSASGGPSHTLGAGLRIGQNVDAEANGQQSANADGDDLLGTPDDEDGVTMPSVIGAGTTVNVTVAVINPIAGTAYVYGWIDYNNNGAFDNATERAAGSMAANTNGNVTLTFTVPSGAAIATVGARFRVGTVQAEVQNSTGAAMNGEVEDQKVEISNSDVGNYDFGDAPASYGVAWERKKDNTSRMCYLGAYEATEADRLKHVDGDATVTTAPDPDFRGAGATGDDQDGNDDEDGVVVIGGAVGEPEKSFTLNVTTTRANIKATYVTGWVDWNGNGSFDGSSEQIFQETHGLLSDPASSDDKLHTLPITVPAGTTPRTTYMRVRLHDNLYTDWGPTGGSPNANEAGDVEDYVFVIEPVSTNDFGDAPSSYGSAGHTVGNKAPRMGSSVDGETSALTSNDAGGDDVTDSFDDEGGVDMPAVLSAGATPSISVNVENEDGGTVYIVGWIDYDGNGTFEPGERSNIATRAGTGSGNVTLTFPVVPSVTRNTFARFRMTTNATWGATPSPTGTTTDGEAEDYPVKLEGPISVTLTSFNASIAQGTVYLTWAVESETGVAGYNVFRSKTENGSYEKVNATLISAGRQKSYEFADMPPTVSLYYYKLQEVGLGGDTSMHGPLMVDLLTGVVGDRLVISDFKLYSNYPNPFNPTTTLCYELPKNSQVTLVIYDTSGRVVKELVNGEQAMGRYDMRWDATNQVGEKVASGVYFYRLQAGEFNASAKMLLLK